jgi:hypothetical protein
MKPGFCYVAERTQPGRAAQKIITSFGRIGVVLTNPYTRRITELVGEGDQRDITEAGLTQAVAVRSAMFQLWFSSDTDVTCGFRKVDRDRVSHAYSLDGLDARERERLMQWAVDYFREAAVEGTAVLLVVDPAGVTVDVDWDAVVRQTIPFPAVLPAILGLPASWMRHVGDHSGYSRERIADFELLRRQSLRGDETADD